MKKQFWAIWMALVMVLSMASVAFAGEESAVAFIGDNGYPTLQDAVNAASDTDETVITLVDGNIDGDVNITIAAVGNQKGDIKIVAQEGATPVITGTVTLGLYEKGTFNVAKWDAAVTFEGITFDHTESGKHSINVQSVGGLTLTNCTIVGDGEYGIGSAAGGNSDPATITDCTFTDAGMQVTGNFGTGLVIDNCTFNDSCINVQGGGGNGVTVKNSTFNATVTDAHVDDSFYAIRSNDIAITVENTEFNIDSTVTGVATEQNWGVLWQRQAGNTKWTVNNIGVNYTEAAMAQTELLLNKNDTTVEANKADRVTITGLTPNSDAADLIAKSEGYLVAEGLTYLDGKLDLNGKVAKIDSQSYESLQDAIDAAVNGDTITLLTDITEDVTVVQAPDVKITIDGGNNTFSGTITIDGKSAAYATAALTIQNVKFDATNIGENACINLGVSGNNNTRYTSNVTVNNCTFTDTDESAVGIKNYTGGCKNLTITNCTATGMHSLMQVKGVTGLTIDKVDINSARGISVGTSTNVSVTNSTIIATGSDKYGIRADGSGAFTMSIEDCDIKAAKPVVVRKTTGAYNLTIGGDETTMTATGTDGCVIITSGDDEETPVKPNDSVGYTAEITGGTYSDNETSEVADGYIVKKNSDTEYVVIVKEKLTSGTYMADPTGFTAAGYLVKDNNDGTWTVYKKSSGGSSSGTSYQIVIEDTDDGDVVASSKSAKRNATVTLTVTADKKLTKN